MRWGPRARRRARKVWLFSLHPLSFNSRCFGPGQVGQTEGILHPLRIVGRGDLRGWADYGLEGIRPRPLPAARRPADRLPDAPPPPAAARNLVPETPS